MVTTPVAKKAKIESTSEFTNVSDEFDSDVESNENSESTPMPIFEDIKSHVTSPFVQLTFTAALSIGNIR